jgi:hypothetical protein
MSFSAAYTVAIIVHAGWKKNFCPQRNHSSAKIHTIVAVVGAYASAQIHAII